MSSTPLMASARGAATVWATVSASAPGNWAVTETVGGTTLGYCSMGSTRMLATPTTVRMIASTVAKIGRLMKKLEKLMRRRPQRPPRVPRLGLGRRFHFLLLGLAFLLLDLLDDLAGLAIEGLRVDGHPRFDAGEVADDHALARLDAVTQDLPGAGHLAQADRTGTGHVVLVEDKHLRPHQALADGDLRHRQHLEALESLEPDTHELAGQHSPLGVGKGGTGLHRTGALLHAGAEEVQAPLETLTFAAIQAGNLQHGTNLLDGIGTAQLAAQLEGITLGKLEAHLERVEWRDGGKLGAVAHQVTDVDPAEADHPPDWRGDLGIVEVDTRTGQRRLGLGHGRACHAQLRARLVILLTTHRVLAEQALEAAGITLGALQLGAGALQVGLTLVDHRLVDVRLDGVEHLPLLHHLAGFEVSLLQGTGDACHQRHLVIAAQQRGVGTLQGDILAGQLGHLHRVRRLLLPALLGLLRGLVLATGGQQKTSGQDEKARPAESICGFHVRGVPVMTSR